jgi:hypothetical protein
MHMAKYMDLFMRDNFGDTGEQPTADAYVSASPDIIPYGQGTLTAEQLVNTYNPPLLDVLLQNNQVNQIYVRAKNNYNGPTSGKIYLYYSTANLLVNVSSWKNNLIRNNNGQMYANVSATTQNQIAPGDQPFNFNPSTSLGNHFCFVSRVATTLNPNPLPANDFSSWAAFVYWIRNNAWVAWHNVDIVNTLPASGYINTMAFQNINSTEQFYGFKSSYTNMPQGSTLRMYSLPNPAVGYTGFDSGSQSVHDTGSIAQGAMFPAGYATSIFVTCNFPGSPTVPPNDVSIETTSLGYMENILHESNRFYHSYTILPGALGIDVERVGLASNGGFVQITSFNSLFNPTNNVNLLKQTFRTIG